MKTTPAAIAVRPVATRREKRLFLLFPWRIYRDDPLWAPPILAERAARLDPLRLGRSARNPLFQAGAVAAFIGWKGGQPAGTIGAAIDKRYRVYEVALE